MVSDVNRKKLHSGVTNQEFQGGSFYGRWRGVRASD